MKILITNFLFYFYFAQNKTNCYKNNFVDYSLLLYETEATPQHSSLYVDNRDLIIKKLAAMVGFYRSSHKAIIISAFHLSVHR